jgi:hypothetical protein
MPDEPNPRYDAIAGSVSGAVSMLVFTILIDVTATVFGSLLAPLPDTTVFEAIKLVAVIVGFGLLFTLPLIAPIAATVGYGYKWYSARGQN